MKTRSLYRWIPALALLAAALLTTAPTWADPVSGGTQYPSFFCKVIDSNTRHVLGVYREVPQGDGWTIKHALPPKFVVEHADLRITFSPHYKGALVRAFDKTLDGEEILYTTIPKQYEAPVVMKIKGQVDVICK